MAVVNIKLSQDVLDQQYVAELHTPLLTETLTGTTLKMEFSDGATATYTGFALSDPNAATGSASATGFQFYKMGLLSLNLTGALQYDYKFAPIEGKSGYTLSLADAQQGSAIGSLQLATEMQPDHLAYIGAYGNVTASAAGAFTLLTFGTLTGTASKLTIGTQDYVASASIDGSMHIDLNAPTYAAGSTENRVDGAVGAYRQDYPDGSHFYVSGGAGDDRISIRGGGDLHVVAGDGNDTITILEGEHCVDGGNGVDTVHLSGGRADYLVEKVAEPADLPIPVTGRVYTVTAKDGTVNTLMNVERIAFANTTLALDIDGNGGAGYRLYQAAFNRKPDAVGLGLAYWVGVLDNSKGADMASVLAAMSESAENKAGLIGVIGNGFAYTPYGAA